VLDMMNQAIAPKTISPPAANNNNPGTGGNQPSHDTVAGRAASDMVLDHEDGRVLTPGNYTVRASA
jgi:hypothetical protein